MNLEGIGCHSGRKEFSGENLNLRATNSDLSEKQSDYLKEKEMKGMSLVKSKIKNKLTMGPGASYDQCFSGSNFASQYEDECPVNYSLKYSETEPCKAVGKCETNDKKKFKGFTDYTETDLDQPTNFSLKYTEKTYDEVNKNSAFNFYHNSKVKFKEYTDYVETDLDQPTDFTLKYRESTEEEVNFFESEEQKTSSAFGPRMASEEGAATERLPERYSSQNETPLMFSRSSSMNSLSSFVHITQSIPDDRSSIVSDFSRMTSGIISPSELPDSPTQTAPSSPKRSKISLPFSSKPDFLTKESVFEDDVATYKQEGTPIEFSRATSLSSLNIDNTLKSELLVKRNPGCLVGTKEENQNSADLVDSDHLKQQVVPEKSENEKGKFELASVLEVDESLFADCISIDIQINCRKPKTNYGRLLPQDNSNNLRQINGLQAKPNLRLRFHNENKKNYASFEGSDDAVHTYHTEGTPANVSHAGSHSDLSALSLPLLGLEDNSDSESSFPELAQTVSEVKTESIKNTVKIINENQPVTVGMNPGVKRDVYVNNQSQLGYLGKDHHQFTAKDETATFATENSPCNISVRSSLSDLTVNVVDGTFSINSVQRCEGPPSQLLSPLRNVSPQSPNSLVFEEAEDGEKCSKEQRNEFLPTETIEEANDSWHHSNEVEGKPGNKLLKEEVDCFSAEPVHAVSFDLNSIQPLTPFEEALVEECIRLGMPQRKNLRPQQEMHIIIDDDGKLSETPESGHCAFTKSDFDGSKNMSGKNIFISGTVKPNPLCLDNFEFDSSEPLTPFEEVLLEQCIRLGMPQKRNYKKFNGSHSVYSNEELMMPIGDEIGETYLGYDYRPRLGGRRSKRMETIDCNSTELITALETALLEQCIRMGMPQRKIQKREGNASSEDPNKGISTLTAHLSRLKLNSENEKDKDKDIFKKCENCPCGKKHSNRKKSISCKKFKNRFDHFKVES